MSSQVEQHTGTVEPSDMPAHDRRYWAAVIDVWLVPWILGVGARSVVAAEGDAAVAGALAAAALLMATEARTGRTPGKAVTGLRTQQVGGGPVGPTRAVTRRWWMALPAIGLLPGLPAQAGGLLMLAVVGVLVLSMGRASDGRGWHDRLAGTEVVTAQPPLPRRGLAAAGIVAALVIIAIGWWFTSPTVGSRSFHGFAEADQVGCELSHDGWLYPRRQQTVVLAPGDEPFVGRFGPHDITLAFIDEREASPSRRGLQLEVATRSLLGTSSRSTGTDRQLVDTTTGPGLGTLAIRCQAPTPDTAPEPDAT